MNKDIAKLMSFIAGFADTTGFFSRTSQATLSL